MNKIPIVFTFDSNLVLPAGVCLHSLLNSANNDTFYEIFILYIDLTEKDINELMRLKDRFNNFTINFINVSNSITKNGYEIRGITATAYLRLLIPQVLSTYSKVLYSDVDVIINEDLSSLIKKDLSYKKILGVKADGVSHSYKVKNGFDLDYINSGFLVFNIDNITDKEIIKSIELIGTSNYEFQDQDILNIVYKGQIDSSLHPRYVFTPSKLRRLIRNDMSYLEKLFNKEQLLELNECKGIIHYAGPKPWNNCEVEMQDFWWNTYRESIYFDSSYYFKFQEKYSIIPELPSLIRFVLKRLFLLKFKV